MAALTVAPAVSGSLSKLQTAHVLHCLRSCCLWGCRVPEKRVNNNSTNTID